MEVDLDRYNLRDHFFLVGALPTISGGALDDHAWRDRLYSLWSDHPTVTML